MTIAEDLRLEFEEMVEDDTFGESVVYVQGGVSKTIRAHMYRKGTSSFPMRNDRSTESKPNRYDFELRVSNGVENGISAIIPKLDKVQVVKDYGGPIFTMRVMEIIGQDPGTFLLGLAV